MIELAIAALIDTAPADKYRNWKPAPMHTDAQMNEIIRNNVHICEITQNGPCKGRKIIRVDGYPVEVKQ